MNNFFEADAVESAPDYKTLISQGHATDGNPSLGVPATLPGAAWFDSVTQELVNAIKAAGLTPEVNKVDQLANAIRTAGTTAKAGIVQLSSAINSSAENLAATPKAVKQAYDLANQANQRDVSGIPTGSLVAFAGTTIPKGFLLCNGATVSRTTYAKLFEVIGTKWGSGDGSTTFNLPDFNDRFIEGTTDTTKVGKKLEAGLPNITGSFTIQIDDGKEEHTGVFNEVSKSNTQGYNRTGRVPGWDQFNFDANANKSIFKDNTNTVQPASCYTLMIIKVQADAGCTELDLLKTEELRDNFCGQDKRITLNP